MYALARLRKNKSPIQILVLSNIRGFLAVVGWFRIVTSPAQARQVISQNKLAVLLGVEYGTLFDCNESSEQCTTGYIRSKLDDIARHGDTGSISDSSI